MASRQPVPRGLKSTRRSFNGATKERTDSILDEFEFDVNNIAELTENDDVKAEDLPEWTERERRVSPKKRGRTKGARGGKAKKPKKSTNNTKKTRAANDGEHSPNRKKSPKSIVTMEDFAATIDNAVSEQRIDEKKAQRLNECLQSGSWIDIAYGLMCEQIPMKRKGKGYTCRVCQVPKKGHTCMYCHVCSTPDTKFKKDDEHVCINCPTCFEVGKKNKKLIQIKCEGHVCPHDNHKQPTRKVSV